MPDRPKTPVRASISRVSSSRGDGYVNITLTDESSSIQFVDIELSYAAFGELVTGGSYMLLDAELRGLENVGKKFVHERRSIHCPLQDTYKREPLQAWLEEHGKEEGWIVNSYLGSQGSVVSKYGTPGCTLHYQVFKYV